ncbi:MAG TPA: alpha/beta hydrolase [Blastocatellia bacterium]|nr:alpha/beta hydrolase [Blastocatellia bacterium]
MNILNHLRQRRLSLSRSKPHQAVWLRQIPRALAIAASLSLSSIALAGTIYEHAMGDNAAPHNGAIEVTRVEFPVILSDNQVYTIVGFLYVKQRIGQEKCKKKPDTVQVLLHGGGYNHKYWDAGTINGVDYSYARFMAEKCYAVLALDRLGAGESSKPDGDFLDKDENAASIAQVLISLRANHNPTGRKFKQIALVGHSLGTFSSIYTLGTYGPLADALVATGWVNAPGVVPLDPAFFQALLANPYSVLPSEARSALFYYSPSADPDVIAFDNASLADTVTRGFLLDTIEVLQARALGDVAAIKALTRVDQVTIPVFLQLGDQDVLSPASSAVPDAAFYAGAPSVTINTLTDMGHDYNLHLNRLTGWQAIVNWLASTLDN